MNEKSEFKQRMYCLVLRHLSGINKGIQCTHACEQYGNLNRSEPDYRRYIEDDMTLIVLDGGTSPEMNQIEQTLLENSVQFYAFREPDLSYLITAICFLVDESIWDRENYLTKEEYFELNSHLSDEENEMRYIEYIGGIQNYIKAEITKGKKLAI